MSTHASCAVQSSPLAQAPVVAARSRRRIPLFTDNPHLLERAQPHVTQLGGRNGPRIWVRGDELCLTADPWTAHGEILRTLLQETRAKLAIEHTAKHYRMPMCLAGVFADRLLDAGSRPATQIADVISAYHHSWETQLSTPTSVNEHPPTDSYRRSTPLTPRDTLAPTEQHAPRPTSLPSVESSYEPTPLSSVTASVTASVMRDQREPETTPRQMTIFDIIVSMSEVIQ